MTVAFDAYSSSTTTTNPSWTHTPVGTPRGIIVVITASNTGDDVSAVTYGGNSMTEVSLSPIDSTQTATPTASMWLLGTSVPTGAQTVAVTNSKGSVKVSSAISLTAAADVIEQDTSTLDAAAQTNPSVTLSLGGATSFCVLGFGSGVANLGSASPLSNWNSRDEWDAGSFVGGVYTYDTIASTDVTAGYTAASADALILAGAFTESGGGASDSDINWTGANRGVARGVMRGTG
jgi:hypothetical protein